MHQVDVLIVEEDAAVARVLEFWLRASGLRALAVQSGEEALQRADNQRPRAVVTDVCLPGIDGLEVTRRLKRQTAAQPLPVFLISACYEPHASEADGFFRKPGQLTRLVDTLVGHIAGTTLGNPAPGG